MGEGERRAYHDLMSEYADAKREAREARALVRELVEAGKVLLAHRYSTWVWSTDAMQQTPKEIQSGFDALPEVIRWQAAKARASGYTEEGE